MAIRSGWTINDFSSEKFKRESPPRIIFTAEKATAIFVLVDRHAKQKGDRPCGQVTQCSG